jgi:Ca2+-dependent lipid-binding protein
MDPFVILTVGTQKFKTKTLGEAGKNPVWSNEVFDFDVKNIKDELHMQVFDEDPSSNDLVGESKIILSSLAIKVGLDEWFVIRYFNKKVGTVHLKVKWFPSG